MDMLRTDFVKYLDENLGLHVVPEDWVGEKSLPLYLRERYAFFQVNGVNDIGGVVVLVDRDAQTPAVVEKDIRYLAEKAKVTPVYLRQAINSYDRKRLIERKIPFVVPRNQMYLPFLGVDLRERFLTEPKKVRGFGPATQFLLLFLLQEKNQAEINQSKAAERLGYTSMTISRAFQEIENAEIGNCTKTGKERFLRLKGTRREIWQAALPYLQTPVQKRIYVDPGAPFAPNDAGFCLAGESALAKVSIMAEPPIPVYAVQSTTLAKSMERNSSFQIVPYPDGHSIELELWSYPVRLQQDADRVDPLSLVLSLQERADERTQGALERLVEEVLW